MVHDNDLYRMLQVDPAAESEVIEAAFRRLARKYHPDVRVVEGDTTARMQQLNHAYTILRDPDRRADYDRQRQFQSFASPMPIATMPASTPGPAPTRRHEPVNRRRAILGVAGGVLLAAGGLALGGLTLQDYLQQQHAATPPPRPAIETIAALTQRARLVGGPLAGTFRYGATSGITHVERADAQVSLRDFIAEARFFVPYDRREGQWDCGLLFRNTGATDQYRLIVSSGGRYQLDLWERADVTTIAHDTLTGVNVDPAGYNDLRVLVNGGQSYFYLNGVYVTTLDTARYLMSGDISVATALYNGDALPSRTMQYERFTVLSLDH